MGPAPKYLQSGGLQRQTKENPGLGCLGGSLSRSPRPNLLIWIHGFVGLGAMFASCSKVLDVETEVPRMPSFLLSVSFW